MPAFESEEKKLSSRKERRKDARKAKNQARRLQSWTQHQAKKKITSQTDATSESGLETRPSKIGRSKRQMIPMGKKSARKHPQTKFEEYLEMEKKKTAGVSAEEDLALERRLGKKLKVKHGLFHSTSDGLSDLLEGMVSSSDILQDRKSAKIIVKGAKSNVLQGGAVESDDEDEGSNVSDEIDLEEHAFEGDLDEDSGLDASLDVMDEEDGGEPCKLSSDAGEDGGQPNDAEDDEGGPTHAEKDGAVSNAERFKAEDGQPLVKYVAPHLRVLGNLSDELTQLQRRCRGLLNRLSEENVELITQDFFSLFQVHGRRPMTDIVTNEIMGAVCSGPRGNEQYAAVFAAFVAGIASSVGMDFGAKFLASLAENFQEQCKREDSLAVRNMTLLLSYLYSFKLVSCDVIYDLMCSLSKSLTELDVATILTILQTCGMGLRADDPAAMKDFVLSVQHRCEELKAAAVQSGTIFFSGKRMEFMLETICEIKNNRRRVKQESTPHVRLKKWLQKLGIEQVQLRTLTWKKLLDPDKKGQWWISGVDIEHREGSIIEVTDFVDKEGAEAEKMLQLAASQRMNTDIRRAIFCVIMSGEDYLDAFEKILRIKLSGKQDREVMRVIVECCLQEKVFNKYYSLLIGKLCHHDKNHKFTLQYCLWDHFKQLSSMETRRVANLAHLLADLIANFSLSLAVLKVVEFADTKTMTPKAILHFCIFFKVLLTGYSDEVVWNVFARIAAAQELEGLRAKLSIFLNQHLIKGLQTKDSHDSDNQNTSLMKRFSMIKKAMANSSGLR